MKRILSTYLNCSLGGMTSVYRARALANPNTHFDLVFVNDRGGLSAFTDLSNCNVRIINQSRLNEYLTYALGSLEYDLFTVTSQPDVIEQVPTPATTRVVYEIHSPIESIVAREVKTLNVSKIDEVWAPSEWAVSLVRSCLPRRKHVTINCHANLVDGTRFSADIETTQPLKARPDMTPIIWIGRMENFQKNYIDFLRALRLMPPNFYGLMLFSLEKDPGRLSAVLGSAAMLGVEDRIDVYLDVAQQDVGSLHRAARNAGGVFCSTALSESFGYGVLEAGKCGLPVAAYDVGPLNEHSIDNLSLVPVGDLPALADAMQGLAR